MSLPGNMQMSGCDPGEAEKMRDIPHSIRVFEISGPLFFAAADEILTITSDKSTKVIVIRMRSVPQSMRVQCVPA